MLKELKVLQANLRKSPGAQLNLMNDESLQDFALLLITEPSCYRNADEEVIVTPMYHNYWTQMLPKKLREGRVPARSMIWVKKGISQNERQR